MTLQASDKVFTHSIAEIYETQLVPLIFAPYAEDLARRVAALAPRDVLEVAAGTGVVTRAMDRHLAPQARIVATDLNPGMIAEAQRIGTGRDVTWQQADAMSLPFPEGAFDAVVCQFGAMFFPDRPHAYAQMRRVLRPGGTLLFSVWDRIEANDFADEVTQALAALFPERPPQFLARTPHGYWQAARIADDVQAAGFPAPRIHTIAARSRAQRAADAAIAYCTGTPLRNEIEGVSATRMQEAIDAGTRAIAARFGDGPVDGAIQAHVVVAARDAQA